MIVNAAKDELLIGIHDAIAKLAGLIETLEPDQFNAVPFEGSWTPAQVVEHVRKSVKGLARALDGPGQPADRDPQAKAKELRMIFLDFARKMKSPEFIVPEERVYEKHATLEGLAKAEALLDKNAGDANLTDLVAGLPMGDVTKIEIIHFILYHTLRHVHQLENIKAHLLVDKHS